MDVSVRVLTKHIGSQLASIIGAVSTKRCAVIENLSLIVMLSIFPMLVRTIPKNLNTCRCPSSLEANGWLYVLLQSWLLLSG